MENSQLVSLLKTFSAYEMNSFSKFIRSPFFNKNKKLIRLSGIFEKCYPDFSPEIVSNKNLLRKIFGDGGCDDSKIRFLIHEYLRLARDFVAHSSLKNDEITKCKYLLDEFQIRKLNKQYGKMAGRFNKVLEPNRVDKINFYNNKQALEQYMYKYDYLEIDKRVESDPFISEAESITCSFIINLVHNLYNTNHAIKNHNVRFRYNIARFVLERTDLESIVGKLAENHSPAAPIAEMYFHLSALLLQEAADGSFYKLKELILQNADLLNKVDMHNLYTNLESYCIRRVNSGAGEFILQQFEIYNKMLEFKIHPFNERRYFPDRLFLNMVRSALRLKKTDWAFEFIEMYNKRLHPELRNEILNYSKALVYFELKEFEKAIESAALIKTLHYNMKRNIKSLFVRIYYELGFTEPAFDLIESFRHFLVKNKEISEYFITGYMPFLHFTYDLLKLRSGKPSGLKEKAGILLNKINGTVPLANKKWLIEKANELIKN